MGDPESRFDRSVLYRHYVEHKRWLNSNTTSDVDRFSRIVQKLNLPPNAAILEIGFGEGWFLDWARASGYRVEGIDILPEMVDSALARGHVVSLGTIDQIAVDSRFNLIAAFDVVEHLDLAEISELFDASGRLLTLDGMIVLQFPNAASPFSALYQSGDATHQTAVSESLLQQIAQTKGFVVRRSFNARARSRHLLKQLRNSFTHLIRDCIEVVISLAYYGVRCPLDPNIVVVLERGQLKADTAK